jgi:hypothetical protein
MINKICDKNICPLGKKSIFCPIELKSSKERRKRKRVVFTTTHITVCVGTMEKIPTGLTDYMPYSKTDPKMDTHNNK